MQDQNRPNGSRRASSRVVRRSYRFTTPRAKATSSASVDWNSSSRGQVSSTAITDLPSWLEASSPKCAITASTLRRSSGMSWGLAK